MSNLSIAAAIVAAALSLPASAAECQPDTKAKLASISAEQSDKTALCQLLGGLSQGRERFVSRDDMEAVLTTHRKLRAAGYRGTQLLSELVTIETIRPPDDLLLVAAVYEKTRGCLTPSLVYRDIANALRTNGRDASLMYKKMSREGYVNYLALIANAEGCKVSG